MAGEYVDMRIMVISKRTFSQPNGDLTVKDSPLSLLHHKQNRIANISTLAFIFFEDVVLKMTRKRTGIINIHILISGLDGVLVTMGGSYSIVALNGVFCRIISDSSVCRLVKFRFLLRAGLRVT